MAIFTNQAAISYNGVTVNSNIVTGEITEVISLLKRATAATYTDGDIVTYVVNIQNSGNTDYNNLTLTDNLGEYAFGATTVVPLTYTGDPVLYTVNGRVTASPTVVAGPPMVITGINVPAGGYAELIYRVRANEFAPLGGTATITNTASITGAGITETSTASATVTAATAPELSIFKELSPTTVVENGQVTYTFTIENRGAEATAVGTDGVVITDTFTPALEAPITVTLNGTVLTEADNYTYDSTTGVFTTVAGAITVPGATYTQNAATGAYTVNPGRVVLTVTGTI